MTVAIEVGHRTGLVRTVVDQAPLKWDLCGTGSGPYGECRSERGTGSIDRESAHATD